MNNAYIKKMSKSGYEYKPLSSYSKCFQPQRQFANIVIGDETRVLKQLGKLETKYSLLNTVKNV
jgi:hypothetical protein